MRSFKLFTLVTFVSASFLFACRGGVHKNNDHDYDGKNENNDGTTIQQMPNDTSYDSTVSRYPIDENATKDSANSNKK